LFNFGRFQRRNAPKTRLLSRFLGWYGTLFKVTLPLIPDFYQKQFTNESFPPRALELSGG